LNLCKAEKNFDLLPNFWYIKDSNITSEAQRKIFEKGTIFFGHPVYLPTMHIKVGLKKIFVTALDREGQALAFLRNNFPKLSEARVKERSLLVRRYEKLCRICTFPAL
jgi:hypothetical protein